MSVTGNEDRGDDFEEVITRLSSLSRSEKELAMEYLAKALINDPLVKEESDSIVSTTSTLKELVARYPNVDFAGFISRDNDKEHYQLWKLIDAFEEVSKRIGQKKFEKLKITLIVFGNRITYVSNGSIAINYERFSKEDLVKQLLKMSRQQG